MSGNEKNIKIGILDIQSDKNNIDKRLNDLEKELNQGSFSYEKVSEGFFIIVDGNKLDIPFKNQDELLKNMKLINHVLKVYREAGYKGKLYVSKDNITSNGYYVDLKVDDSGFISDTTFLTYEAMEKNGISNNFNTRSEDIGKFAEFLNEILGVK